MAGRYRLDALIGAGGVAHVYAARDADGAELAVKVMRDDAILSPRLVAQFELEGRVMSRFSHPNIAAAHASGRMDDGTPYLVMELLRGVPLDRLVDQRGPLPPDEALVIADQVLDALAACHAAGVIHRDLKPANLFVTRDGVVKVLDFGCARVPDEVDPAEASGTRLGTPAFMAPEQALNAVQGANARSDIFAVGATLYLLLSGRRIRETDESDAAFILAATTPPTSLARVAPRLPLSLIRLVDTALAWSPEDRFPTAEAMSDAIRAALERGEPSGGGAPTEADASLAALRAALGSVVARDEESLDPEARRERTRTLKELFRLMAAVFGTSNQYSWDHDQTRARRGALFDTLSALLDTGPAGLSWLVRPYGFDFGGEPVWEPTSGADDIPYNLFSSGFRTVRILPGLTRDELDELLRLFLTDPVRELPPEDDLGSVFVERRFAHVEAQLVGAFDMDLLRDQLDLQDQLADLRREVASELNADLDDRAGVAGLMAEVGEAGIREADVVAITFSAGAIEQLAATNARVVAEAELQALRARFHEEAGAEDARTWLVLARAVEDAHDHGDLELMREPFAELAREYVANAAPHALVALVGGMRAYLRADVVHPFLGAVLTEDAARLFLEIVAEQAPRGDRALGCTPLAVVVLDCLDRGAFPHVLRAYGRCHGSPTAARLRPFIERNADTGETALGAELESASGAFAAELIAWLAAGKRDQLAHRALQRAARNPDATVRVGALPALIRQPSEAALAEVAALVQHKQSDVRSAAVRVISEARLAVAAPRLLPLLLEDQLHDRSLLERQALIRFLLANHAPETERTLSELTRRQGLFGDKRSESTRKLAVELLGALGTTTAGVEAVRAAASGLLGGREVREAARAALDRLKERGVA